MTNSKHPKHLSNYDFTEHAKIWCDSRNAHNYSNMKYRLADTIQTQMQSESFRVGRELVEYACIIIRT